MGIAFKHCSLNYHAVDMLILDHSLNILGLIMD